MISKGGLPMPVGRRVSTTSVQHRPRAMLRELRIHLSVSAAGVDISSSEFRMRLASYRDPLMTRRLPFLRAEYPNARCCCLSLLISDSAPGTKTRMGALVCRIVGRECGSAVRKHLRLLRSPLSPCRGPRGKGSAVLMSSHIQMQERRLKYSALGGIHMALNLAPLSGGR